MLCYYAACLPACATVVCGDDDVFFLLLVSAAFSLGIILAKFVCISLVFDTFVGFLV